MNPYIYFKNRYNKAKIKSWFFVSILLWVFTLVLILFYLFTGITNLPKFLDSFLHIWNGFYLMFWLQMVVIIGLLIWLPKKNFKFKNGNDEFSLSYKKLITFAFIIISCAYLFFSTKYYRPNQLCQETFFSPSAGGAYSYVLKTSYGADLTVEQFCQRYAKKYDQAFKEYLAQPSTCKTKECLLNETQKFLGSYFDRNSGPRP